MSLYGALFAGVSGLAAQSSALGVISDNIANVNTVGYKAIESRFSTLVTQETTLSQHSPGGVISSPYTRVTQQGLLQGSSSGTDLAVAGNGFFIVNEQAVPTLGADFIFTRAGSFNPDESGDLVNTAGFYLQGYNLQTNPAPPPSARTFSGIETVNISNLSGSATSTSQIGLGVNLPSIATVGDTFSVTTQIFDSLGNPSDFDLTFTKTGSNAWDFTATDPTSAGVTVGTAAGAGDITFATDGTPSVINITTPFAITGYTTGAADSNLTLDLGTIGDTDGLTQFAGNFTITAIEQDGVRFGTFTGINIGDDGIVTALFDNGDQLDIYQIPLATFANANGLGEISGNGYLQTNLSGGFQLNLTGNGGAGRIVPGALENSTVDLAEEFTNIIITQRAYSASAQVISAADELLEELIRIR